jgi:hypothetical protein
MQWCLTVPPHAAFVAPAGTAAVAKNKQIKMLLMVRRFLGVIYILGTHRYLIECAADLCILQINPSYSQFIYGHVSKNQSKILQNIIFCFIVEILFSVL